VDPYGIGLRRGAWYLVGHDHDREDLRSFRLDRVVGSVTLVGEPGAFDPPTDVDVAGHIAGPSTDERDVDVAVAAEARWTVEAHGARPTGAVHGDRPVYRFTGTDPARLVPWLLGLGPDVLVVAPEDVRADVIRRLTTLGGTA
jgi:proteasome accessory factor B